MSLIGFKAQNHPQQTLPAGGPKDEVDERAWDLLEPFDD